MNKCIDHPRMVFKGTLHYEGHSVSFKINDDDVTVMDTNDKKSTTTHISIDRAIEKQRDLLKWGYTWI
tara:strand:+ start:28 stop:231 length:204 start_codon:yes stop_codon:yes gene_type:complete